MDYRRFASKRFFGHCFSFPFIWLPLLAFVLLDLLVSLYQAVCFPIYNLKKVERSRYIMISDRAKLDYLPLFDKLSCMYCGYANGFLLYAKEIAGRTEKYWCGVKHQTNSKSFKDPNHRRLDFAAYGDESEFDERYGPRQ